MRIRGSKLAAKCAAVVRVQYRVWGSVAHRTSEPALADYWSGYVSSSLGPGRYAARHALATLSAMVSIARLPRLTAAPGEGVEGAFLRRHLSKPVLAGIPFGLTGVAALEVPVVAGDYLQGSNKQTLRRKIRAANKHGITLRTVEDPGEQKQLLDAANMAERQHPDELYRVANPQNYDLLSYSLWLVACNREGVPILLSVTPMDSEWGMLRYFRTLGAGPEHSDSRYLMIYTLVDMLSQRGVRHLVDMTHPSVLPNGLRHFQRMVGFRYIRVRMAGP